MNEFIYELDLKIFLKKYLQHVNIFLLSVLLTTSTSSIGKSLQRITALSKLQLGQLASMEALSSMT